VVCLIMLPSSVKLYACGEGTNGRLGVGHSNNVSVPRQLTALSQYVVKKVAVHSGGKHAMALTLDGKVNNIYLLQVKCGINVYHTYTMYKVRKV